MGKRKIFYGYYIVAVCTLLMATMFCLRINLFSLFVVPVTEGMGISRSQFSLISTIASFIGMILSPVAGKVLAQKNIRYIMTAAIAVCTLSYGSLALAHEPWHLYVSAVGIGLSFIFVANLPVSILLNRWFVKNRATVTSIAFAGANIGAMILSPIVTFMLEDLGWRETYSILGIGMCVILVPIVFFVVRGNPNELGLEAYGASGVNVKSSESNAVGLSLKELRKTATFWLFLTGLTLVVLCIGVQYHMPAHITKSLGYSSEQAALFVSIYSFVAIFGKFLIGAVFDKKGSKAGILICAGSLTILFIFLASVKDFIPLCIGGAFYGIGGSCGTLLAPLLVGRTFGNKYFGEIAGFVNAFTAFAMAINNPLFASVYDITGSYTPAWIGGAAVSMIGVALLLLCVNRGKSMLASAMAETTDN